MRNIIITLLAATFASAPALALTVQSGSVSVTAADPDQAGRLSRNNVPQDWSGGEEYPGEINTGTTYHYTSFIVPFAANALQDVYYQIDIDDAATDLFSSAYLGVYDPLAKQVNWLGDAGTSGNYFGVNPLFYQVVVPAGGVLRLVFNSTNAPNATPPGVPTSTADYLVEAFSDTEYDEDFQTAAVPEPATWAMTVGGFGVIGSAMRRRKAKTSVSYA